MDYEKNLGYLINKAARMTKYDLNNALAEEEITSAQWGLIRDIYLTESMCGSEEEILCKLTPAAIAERLHADRPTISCMVEKLVKQDLVYRVSNPKDRRSQIILLTDKTRGLMPKLEKLGDNTLQKALEGFSEEEAKHLKQYLIRMIENLKP